MRELDVNSDSERNFCMRKHQSKWINGNVSHFPRDKVNVKWLRFLWKTAILGIFFETFWIFF